MALTPYERTKLWRENNPDAARRIYRESDKRYKEKYGINKSSKSVRKHFKIDPRSFLLKKALERARSKGIDADIEISDIVIPELCLCSTLFSHMKKDQN